MPPPPGIYDIPISLTNTTYQKLVVLIITIHTGLNFRRNFRETPYEKVAFW